MSSQSTRRNLDFAFPAFAPGLPSVYERAGFDVNKPHYAHRNGSQSTFGSGSSQGRSRQGSVSSAARSAALRLAGQASSGGTAPDTPSALSSVVCSADCSADSSTVPSRAVSQPGILPLQPGSQSSESGQQNSQPTSRNSNSTTGLNFDEPNSAWPHGPAPDNYSPETHSESAPAETGESPASGRPRPTSERPNPAGLAALSRRTPPQSPLDATFPPLTSRDRVHDSSLPESLQNMAPPRADDDQSMHSSGPSFGHGSRGSDDIITMPRSQSGQTEMSKLSDMDMSMVSSIHDSQDEPEPERPEQLDPTERPEQTEQKSDSSYSHDDSVNRGDSTATSNSSGSGDLDLDFPGKLGHLIVPEQVNRFSTTSSIYSESPDLRESRDSPRLHESPRPFLQHREQHRELQREQHREQHRELQQRNMHREPSGRRPSAPQVQREPSEVHRQHTLQRKTTLRRKPTLPPAHRMQENTTNIERGLPSPPNSAKKTAAAPRGLGLGMTNVDLHPQDGNDFHSHEDSMPPEQHKPFVPPHRTLSGRATTTTGYAYSTPPLNVRKDEHLTEDVDINNPGQKPKAKETKPPKVCRGCSEPIAGKSIHSKDGNLSGRWHRECFKCNGCAGKLKSEVYVLDDTPYCRPCYHEANNSACRACGGGIEGSCLETRLTEEMPDASGSSEGEQLIRYHPHCLRCVECQVDLLSSYFEVDGGNYCAEHASGASEVPENIKQRYTRFAMI